MTSRIGIQSVELAAPFLRALADAPGPLPLKALAAAAGMPGGQAHKYLTSLVRCGLAAQSAPGEPYALGPLCFSLGLAALRGLDVIAVAQEALDTLRDRLKTSAVLAVWGNQGPTIVRWAMTSHVMSPVVRLGTVFPVTTSLLGLVFSAYLEGQYTRDMIKAELADPAGAARQSGLRRVSDLEKVFESIRKDRCIGGPTIADGVVAIAAPVFDHTGDIVAVIAVAGLGGRFEVSRRSTHAETLIEIAEALSRRLGHSY